MRHQGPSSEYGVDGTDSRHGGRGASDEQRLYGDPCHEVQSSRDEQSLYGEPQHETHEESSDLPDLELLFARMRGESGTGSVTLSSRSRASQVETTEQ